MIFTDEMAREVFAQHPLPWSRDDKYVRDANGREILRTVWGYIDAVIVASVNEWAAAHPEYTQPRTLSPAEEREQVGLNMADADHEEGA